jgi:hypothetical protein
VIVELKVSLMVDGTRIRDLFRRWRWLEVGEWVQAGDQCCAKGERPETILYNNAWQMAKHSHPVRTKRTERIMEKVPASTT